MDDRILFLLLLLVFKLGELGAELDLVDRLDAELCLVSCLMTNELLEMVELFKLTNEFLFEIVAERLSFRLRLG